MRRGLAQIDLLFENEDHRSPYVYRVHETGIADVISLLKEHVSHLPFLYLLELFYIV